MSPTVRQLIEDELEPHKIHSVTVTSRSDSCIYVLVASERSAEQIETAPDYGFSVLDQRTVAVDLNTESVTATDNGLWLPMDEDLADRLPTVIDRSISEIEGEAGDDWGPCLGTALDTCDPQLLLDRELDPQDDQGQHVSKMDSYEGIDPSRSWGFGAGPPEEIEDMADKLVAAGLDPSDHFSRLVWGKKEPMDREPRPIEEMTGNYGIELQPRDEGLVALDVDYPDEFPDVDLPETLEVSSPHGSDEQRHIVFRCEDKEELADEFGAWALQGVDWGDLWIGDRYLVGPGSQLCEFGCDEGEHERGEPGGCDRCEDPDAGYYEIVSDEPIREIDAQAVLELVEASEGYELRDEDSAPETPQDAAQSGADDEDPDEVPPGAERECNSCGAVRPRANLIGFESAGSVRWICKGGCD